MNIRVVFGPYLKIFSQRYFAQEMEYVEYRHYTIEACYNILSQFANITLSLAILIAENFYLFNVLLMYSKRCLSCAKCALHNVLSLSPEFKLRELRRNIAPVVPTPPLTSRISEEADKFDVQLPRKRILLLFQQRN